MNQKTKRPQEVHTFNERTGFAMGASPHDSGAEVMLSPLAPAHLRLRRGMFIHATALHGISVVEVEGRPWLVHDSVFEVVAS